MLKRIFFLLVFSSTLSFVHATEKSPKEFLDELHHAAYKVILSDGSTATASTVAVERKWNKDLCALSIKNISAKPLSIREVIVFDWQHGLADTTKIYGEAFQMLGQVGGTLGNPQDLGTYADRSHYNIPEPENMRTAYGMLTLQLHDNERILLATTSCNKFISRFSFDAKRLRISMDCENLVLQPGNNWSLEEFIAVASNNREKLFDELTAAIAVHHPRLKHDPVPAGWCSWYCFGPEVTAQNVSDNTEWIAKNLPALQYIQLDDGYQPWMGDWLDTGKAFNGGVEKVLRQITQKGLQPAIWVAPFIASPQSKIFQQHPDWFVKDEAGKPLPSDKIGFGGWRLGPWYVLDGTNPEVQTYLTWLFKTMREKWGCTYFKLDANYWGAMHGGVHYDKNATRIEAYRRGMEAIRKGAGDAFLLGCNHPMWPSLGLIHGSRSSMDISRNWDWFRAIGKENLLRSWQNGRLWWNDPDCVLLMNDEKEGSTLTKNEFQFHATIIYATGGMVLSGDDLTKITPDKLAMLKKLIPSTGIAARFDNENFEVGVTHISKNENVYSVFNWSDSAVLRKFLLPAGKYKLTDKWTGKSIGTFEKEYMIESLPAHSAMLIEAKK